jgi:hypothetical protein
MANNIRTSVLGSVLGTALSTSLLALAPFGCATSGPATPVDPKAPVELDGARYKLVESGGALDQRTVEFAKANDTIRGCLVSFGMRLRSVTGLDSGIPVITAKQNPANINEYVGTYKSIQPDGQILDKDVTLNFAGDELHWNLESATWSRQPESKQMTDDEKKRCGIK